MALAKSYPGSQTSLYLENNEEKISDHSNVLGLDSFGFTPRPMMSDLKCSDFVEISHFTFVDLVAKPLI